MVVVRGRFFWRSPATLGFWYCGPLDNLVTPDLYRSQKVRKLDFGPLYLPFNNTNQLCVHIILIVYLRPFQRGAAWYASSNFGMRNIGKHVGSASQKCARMAGNAILLAFTLVLGFKCWQVCASPLLHWGTLGLLPDNYRSLTLTVKWMKCMANVSCFFYCP